MLIVGMGGTLSRGSSSERILNAAMSACAALGARTEVFAGPDLDLTAYRYGGDRCDRTLALTSALRRADGVVIVAPAYHGTVSGLVKNAIDYVEDLASDIPAYLEGRALGLIGVAGGWQAAAATLGTLRTIGHSLRGWPTPLGLTVNSAQPLFDADGAVMDAGLQAQIDVLARQLVGFRKPSLHFPRTEDAIA